MGSISVTNTRAPYERRDSAHYGTHQRTSISKTLCTHSLSDITKASNDSNLSGKHDIGRTFDTVDERLTASIVVVELGLGDRVVDIDGGNLELTLTERLVEVVNTGRGLLRDTADVLEVLGVLFVNHRSEITTVVEDHVERLSVGEGSQSLLNAPGVLFLGLALPGKDGDTSRGDGSGSMVLGREDVLLKGKFWTIIPLYRRTQDDQVTSAPRQVKVSMRTAVWMVLGAIRHPQKRSMMNTHVEAASDAGTLQRLLTLVLFADVHETRHLILKKQAQIS